MSETVRTAAHLSELDHIPSDVHTDPGRVRLLRRKVLKSVLLSHPIRSDLQHTGLLYRQQLDKIHASLIILLSQKGGRVIETRLQGDLERTIDRLLP